MGEETAALHVDAFSRWEALFQEQKVIFSTALAREAELVREVEALSRELNVWKAAYQSLESEQKETSRTVLKLERSIGAIKDDNPLLVCLIDGDGTIFSQDFWPLGRLGGRQAASALTKGLIEHATSLNSSLSSRCQVWLTIYCGKKGLMDTLVGNEVCTSEQFEEFIFGFNEASPLFSVVDVGWGKEAADAKIKEHLRLFTRFPQATQVYLGGSHDNGYSTTINHILNEGFGDKLILLKGYKNLAVELQNVDLPQLEIEGLFMSRKLITPPHTRHLAPTPPPHARHLTSSPKIQPQDFDKFKTRMSPVNEPSTVSGLRRFNPAVDIKQHKPRPCTYHYATKCKSGDKCRFAHDYETTPKLLQAIRSLTKLSPCLTILENRVCHTVNCPWGHYCPHGPGCSQHKSGKCKYKGKISHKPHVEHPQNIYPGSMGVLDDQSDTQSMASVSESLQNESDSLSGSS